MHIIEHPKMLYKGDQTKIAANSEEEAAARADGWHDWGKAPVEKAVTNPFTAAPATSEAANVQSATAAAQDNPTAGAELNQMVVGGTGVAAPVAPAAPENQPVDKDALIAQAKSLGINANSTWNVDTIKVRIDEALTKAQ